MAGLVNGSVGDAQKTRKGMQRIAIASRGLTGYMKFDFDDFKVLKCYAS